MKQYMLLLAAFVLSLSAIAGPANPFEVVLVPDTQNYSERFPETYLAQTQWIKDNAEARNRL